MLLLSIRQKPSLNGSGAFQKPIFENTGRHITIFFYKLPAVTEKQIYGILKTRPTITRKNHTFCSLFYDRNFFIIISKSIHACGLLENLPNKLNNHFFYTTNRHTQQRDNGSIITGLSLGWL